MPDVATVSVGIDLNIAKATQDLKAFTSKKYRFGFDNQFSGPLKSITGDIQSFDTSLTKATNRVVAFGAAAAVFKGAQAAFSAFAKATIDVEYSLAAININLNESADGLKKFSADLFGVARQTGQSFETAAKAAEEFARQGLGAEETLKRTRDALILTRIAAVDSADAVNNLTAAVNSFEKEAIGTTDVLNKFVALDTRFAVSSKDLADGLQRAGSVAADAGVSLDKFLAIITAIKQTTGRDGAVIGNALKTIFERSRSPATLKQFEELGIATKDLAGNLLPVDQILQNLASTYDTLSQAQQQQLSKSVANIQQINIFKALLGDLSKAYSVTKQAAEVSGAATDEALTKNLKLNQTLKAQIESTKTSITQFFAAIGNQDLSGIAKNIIGGFEEARRYLSGDSGSEIGKNIGNGILKGISNVLSGPALISTVLVLGKAFARVLNTIRGDVKGLFGFNTIGQQRIEVQGRINDLVKQATLSEYENLKAATTVLQQKRAILAIQERINGLSGATLLTSTFIRPTMFSGKVEGLGGAKRIPNVAKVPNYAASPSTSFLKGSYPIGQGKQGRVLANPKLPDVVFKEYKHKGDKMAIENEYVMSKLLESAGIPIAKTYGSLDRSKKRGGLFKERIRGFEAAELPFGGALEHAFRTRVADAKIDPVDLNERGIIVRGKIDDYMGKDGFQRALDNSVLVDPSDFVGDAEVMKRAARYFGRKKPIQNFADPLTDAIQREMAAGVPKNMIYVDRDKRLVGPDNPQGLLVANRRDEPVGGFQGVNRVLSEGGDPKQAGMMKVPHFAAPLSRDDFIAKGQMVSNQTVEALNKLFGSINGLDSSRIKEVAVKIRELTEGFNKGATGMVTNRILNAQRAARRNEGRVVFDGGTRLDADSRPKEGSGSYQIDNSSFYKGSGPTLGGPGLRGGNMRGGGIGGGGGGGIPPSGGPLGNRDEINGRLNMRYETQRAASLDASTSFDRASFQQTRRERGLAAATERIQARAIEGKSLTPAQQRFFESQLTNRAGTLADATLGPGVSKGARQAFVKSKVSGALDELKQNDIERQAASKQQARLARNQRFSNVALGAAFVAPLAAGFIPEDKGGTRAGQALGATSGALQGAGIGGIFGPVGAGVGAAVGAIVGALGKATKSIEEFSAEIEDASATQSKVVDQTSRVRGLSAQIKEAREDGGDPRVIARLQTQRSEAIRSVSNRGVQEKLAAAGDNETKIADILQEQLDIQKKIDTTGAANIRAKTNSQDSFETKIGKAFALPEKLLGKLGGNVLTGGLSGYLAGASKGLIREGQRKDISESLSDQRGLARTLTPLINDQNVKGLDLKSLNRGTGTEDEIKKLTEAFATLGVQVDVTNESYRDNVGALNDAVTGFKRVKQITDSVGKTARPALINNQSFLGANLQGEDAFRSFGGARRPGVYQNQAQKNQRDTGFLGGLNRLDELGAFGAGGLKGSGDPRLLKAQESATARASKFGLLSVAKDFIGGQDQFKGVPLTGANGANNESVIKSILERIAKGTDEQAAIYARILADGIKVKEDNLGKTGAKPGRYSVGGIEVGAKISTLAPRDPTGFNAYSPQSSAEDREKAKSYFSAHSYTKKANETPQEIVARNKALAKNERNVFASSDTFDAFAGKSTKTPESEATKAAKEATESAAMVAKVLAGSTLQIVVDVRGLTDAAGHVDFKTQIEQLVQNMANINNKVASNAGTPNPPQTLAPYASASTK